MAVIPMEILEKLEIITPVWILLPHTMVAVDRASTRGIPCKDANQAIGKTTGNIVWRHETFVRSRTGDSKFTPVGSAQFTQRFDHHKGRWKPERPAPVGISPFDFF